MPNDNDEQDRLDLTSAMLRNALGERLYLAPIGDDPAKILDIGTGTGIWVVEMAYTFPNAEIVGTDLSNIQPPM